MTKVAGPELINALTRLVEQAGGPVVRPTEIVEQLRFDMPECILSNEELSRLIEKIASRLGRPVKLGE
jgi:hypothetical protein